MKKPPAKGRPAKPSGMLTKLLGQASVPMSKPSSAPTPAACQAWLQEAVNDYQKGEWAQAESRTDALLAQAGVPLAYRLSALNLKATLAARTHRLALAVELYQDLLREQPGHVEALANLGLSLQKLQRHEEAVVHLRQAIALRPGHANSHLNLGLTYQSLGRTQEAKASYEAALALEPGHLQAHFNLAKWWQDAFDFEEASRAYQATLALEPRHADSLANLIFVQHYRYPPDEAAHQALLRRCAQLYPAAPEWPRRPAPPQALRVGLVSADLHQHPVGYFLRDVLLALASTAVACGELRLLAYANAPTSDELTERIRPVFEVWHTVDLWTDERLAAQIRSDGVDILVDLSGRTAGNRLPVFAAKPAPLQVSWLGYFASTGLPQMDAILADPVCVPEGEESLYVEQVVRLPHTRLCMSPPVAAPEPSAAPVLNNGFITFGCYQTLPKINPGVLAAWARILSACPQARLRLQAPQFSDAGQLARFGERLHAAGIDAARVDLLPPVSRAQYLDSYSQVDILLDTFPYPGGTTTAEALWMGVPTLTLAMPGMLGRQGQAMLSNLGLHDWVTHSEAEYVAQAVAWGQGGDQVAERLQCLRQQVRSQAASSPLFDAPRFARDWWAAMQGLWRQKMVA
ncbi:tetratricopeptide repeat protein [Limnohabitans sp.]|uniref:O-linked N-acetylglucosamine transferase, SPINDLY family protein n=1 Tax=Limnohabitans sp. TaxID=1907725 RepID=UPI0025C06311|nr:tetratricopeptide repeat protein [Limnohabitans sp.]